MDNAPTQTITPTPAHHTTRRHNLFLFLTGFFLANALIAEVIGSKIFSLEQWFGWAPAQLTVLGLGPYDFNLTCGVLLWPFVFITTDIINEYFGPAGVRKVSYLAAGLIIYMFGVIWLVTRTPPAAFWLELNGTMPNGAAFDIDYAYKSVFRQGLAIMAGSIVAFLLGQLIDAAVFTAVKKRTGERYIWLRATGSTLVSQAIDSFVVLFVAFNLFGNWSVKQVVAVGIVNYIYKLVVAIGLTPLLYIAHSTIDAYLGKKE